jgi:nucleotide-binding universal stress UspA family protein
MNGFHPILSASENNAREYLARQRGAFLRAGIPVRTVTRLEGAVPGILEEAEHPDVSLIAMATHGRTGLSHLLLGGVCEGVLRQAQVPVFALRPFRPPGFRRFDSWTQSAFRNVLVPLDASGASLSILPSACAFAKRYDARLSFSTCSTPRRPPSR